MTTLQTSSLIASAFMERLVRYLIPYFTGVTQDVNEARAEAFETLISYGARTRRELLIAVQVIILGLSTLETLGEAKTGEMSPSLRLRFRGCANNLNRSCQKTEQILAKRLACNVPNPTDVTAEPVNDLPEPLAEEILQQTQATIAAMRGRPSGGRPAHSPQPKHQQPPHAQADQNMRLWGSAMMQTLADMGMPVQPTPTP